MRKLTAAALIMVVAACSSPTASVTPTVGPATPGSSTAATIEPGASVAPTASLEPSAAASAEPSIGTIQVLPPGAAVEVAVSELNMRRRPSTSARRVDTFDRGTVLVISPTDQRYFGFGPVAADGYHWYPVMVPRTSKPEALDPLPAWPLDYGAAVPVSGWVAGDNGRRPYLTAIPPRCPATVDLANVSAMLPAERLGCFGEPIVLEGTFGCGGCGGTSPGSWKPDWLANPLEFDFLSADASDHFGPLALHFAPAGPPRPAAGSIIRVTAHVDDQRSSRCEMRELGSGTELVDVNSESAQFWCRERLVVDSYEVLGTDPDFPG